jgi:hypothetical protein
MHAGDALWQLYGAIAMLERLQPANAQTSFLAGKMRSCAGVVGSHISVPEPSAVDMGKLLESISGELPEAGAQASAESKPPSQGRDDFRDPEMIEAAKTFVGAMVDSELFEWADMVSDINDKLQGGSAFFTFKQAQALLNIARRGEFDDDFLDRMEDECPMALQAVRSWAANV